MSTDPRVELLARITSRESRSWSWYQIGYENDRRNLMEDAVEDLAELDAADRDAGIARVDTRDEATKLRLSGALSGWVEVDEDLPRVVRAVLVALREGAEQ